jgi:tetratricopeptide (TPR) repeat protein
MRATILIVSCAFLGACASTQPKEKHPAAEQKETIAEWTRRGDASASAGDMSRAEQYYVIALEMGADESAIVRRLLVACVSDERYPSALEYAEQYLRRHPNDMDVSFAAASIYAAVGDRERARALLQTVLGRRPEWAEVHYALASVHWDEAEIDKAGEHYLKYLKLDPEGPLAESARSRLRSSAP